MWDMGPIGAIADMSDIASKGGPPGRPFFLRADRLTGGNDGPLG
jgi:hypothetical protein